MSANQTGLLRDREAFPSGIADCGMGFECKVKSEIPNLKFDQLSTKRAIPPLFPSFSSRAAWVVSR